MQIAWKCLICYTRKKFIDEKDAILRRQSRINSLNVYLYLTISLRFSLLKIFHFQPKLIFRNPCSGIRVLESVVPESVVSGIRVPESVFRNPFSGIRGFQNPWFLESVFQNPC